MELRQSTEIKVRIGPFLDATDGKTPETGITLGAADQAEILKANGVATVDISGATWAAVTGCDGWYDLTITTSFSDTLGHLTVVVQDDSVCLPVFGEFKVVTANYWDSKYSTDKLEVDIAQALGTAITTNGAGQIEVDITRIGASSQSLLDLKDFADAGYDPGTNKVQGVVLVDTTTTNTDMVGTDNAALAATALTDATWTDAKAAFIDHAISTVDTNLDTLLTRITAARAGYLDNLSAGAVALAATALTDVTWTDAKAVFLDHSIATVDTVVDGIQTEIGTAGAGLTDLGGMSSGMQTEVNNQVVDVIRTDTTSEMSQGAPPVDPTIEEMMAYLYFKMRNKHETTTTEDAIYDDAGTTKLFKATLSDDNTTFTKQEYGSG